VFRRRMRKTVRRHLRLVAQWQSGGLITRESRVRVLPGRLEDFADELVDFVRVLAAARTDRTVLAEAGRSPPESPQRGDRGGHSQRGDGPRS
jgi:hypothetical protein